MQSFVEQAQTYAEYHQNVITRYTHLAGVPIIILSLMILLGFIKIIMPGVFEISLACLVTLAVLIYYYRLNWQLALVLTPILLIYYGFPIYLVVMALPNLEYGHLSLLLS